MTEYDEEVPDFTGEEDAAETAATTENRKTDGYTTPDDKDDDEDSEDDPDDLSGEPGSFGGRRCHTADCPREGHGTGYCCVRCKKSRGHGKNCTRARYDPALDPSLNKNKTGEGPGLKGQIGAGRRRATARAQG